MDAIPGATSDPAMLTSPTAVPLPTAAEELSVDVLPDFAPETAVSAPSTMASTELAASMAAPVAQPQAPAPATATYPQLWLSVRGRDKQKALPIVLTARMPSAILDEAVTTGRLDVAAFWQPTGSANPLNALLLATLPTGPVSMLGALSPQADGGSGGLAKLHAECIASQKSVRCFKILPSARVADPGLCAPS